jgi:hypothetical protein
VQLIQLAVACVVGALADLTVQRMDPFVTGQVPVHKEFSALSHPTAEGKWFALKLPPFPQSFLIDFVRQ